MDVFEFFIKHELPTNGPRLIDADVTIIAEKSVHFHVRKIEASGGWIKLHCPGCKVYGIWEAPTPGCYLGEASELAGEEAVEAWAGISGMEAFWIFSLSFVATLYVLSIGYILFK